MGLLIHLDDIRWHGARHMGDAAIVDLSLRGVAPVRAGGATHRSCDACGRRGGGAGRRIQRRACWSRAGLLGGRRDATARRWRSPPRLSGRAGVVSRGLPAARAWIICSASDECATGAGLSEAPPGRRRRRCATCNVGEEGRLLEARVWRAPVHVKVTSRMKFLADRCPSRRSIMGGCRRCAPGPWRAPAKSSACRATLSAGDAVAVSVGDHPPRERSYLPPRPPGAQAGEVPRPCAAARHRSSNGALRTDTPQSTLAGMHFR